MASDLGRTIIVLQGAVDSQVFEDDTERDEYLAHFRGRLRETMRQDILTWRNNKRIEDAKPKPPPSPVPDHVQRERDRVASRPST